MLWVNLHVDLAMARLKMVQICKWYKLDLQSEGYILVLFTSSAAVMSIHELQRVGWLKQNTFEYHAIILVCLANPLSGCATLDERKQADFMPLTGQHQPVNVTPGRSVFYLFDQPVRLTGVKFCHGLDT